MKIPLSLRRSGEDATGGRAGRRDPPIQRGSRVLARSRPASPPRTGREDGESVHTHRPPAPSRTRGQVFV
jgi:hypothetical protein